MIYFDFWTDFKEILPEVRKSIQECCFLAVDGEFSGILYIYIEHDSLHKPQKKNQILDHLVLGQWQINSVKQ